MIFKGRLINDDLLRIQKELLKVFGVCVKTINSLDIKKPDKFMTKVYVLLSEYFFTDVSFYINDDDRRYVTIYNFFKNNKQLLRIDKYGFREKMIDEFEKDPYFNASRIRVYERDEEINQKVEGFVFESKLR